MQSDATDAHAQCIYQCWCSLPMWGTLACVSIGVRLLLDRLYFLRDGDSAISQMVRQAASCSFKMLLTCLVMADGHNL